MRTVCEDRSALVGRNLDPVWFVSISPFPKPTFLPKATKGPNADPHTSHYVGLAMCGCSELSANQNREKLTDAIALMCDDIPIVAIRDS